MRKHLARLLAAVLFLAIGAGEAQSTILYAGGEDIDVTQIGSNANTSSCSTRCRSAYARYAVASAPSAVADPPSNRTETQTFTNSSTIWLHVETWATDGNTSSNAQGLGFYGSDGVRRLMLRGTGSVNTVKVSKRTAAGSFTDLVTCNANWPANALGKLDVFLNYAVSGQITLYLNGVQFCTYSGDVTTDSVTAVNQVYLASFSTTTTPAYSEIIVADTDTRNFNLATLAPVAAGTTQSWTPNTVGNINPITINDANFISTGSNTVITEWTVTALPSGTAWSVVAVKQVARLLRGSSGPQTFDFIYRATGGSDVGKCTGTALTTSFANYSCYYTGPTAADLATPQFGGESQP